MSSTKQIMEALEWRYATKRYDATKKISESDWKTLTNSLLMAPSSYGVQPWKFLIVENPQVREQLKAVSWNQTQVTDASHYVVFAYKEEMDEAFIQKYVDRISEVRKVNPESLNGYKAMMIENLAKAPGEKIKVWSQRQAYIAMGFLLETAALLKIDATPMEGLDPASYDKILGLEGSGYKTVATVALGYRHAEDTFQNMQKVRFAEDSVIEYVK
ncbi:NAD(P)H-dependent oxidoreductase [Bdellovibrio reynosensis]|uniref:NAD(P)H-dependent oxidoreductase n=1 Tax=Bdellovibrio reynosensis TaxID=2835041 RepID=A0ABY4CCL0_9BACT|nr:NAD(P)H-dependent oxidoreductase [Bdellovibrio reynosensis]UOF02708.1 NAD(P)H-dependent oxidoreductase [Bdellovibrio reynosensis]